MLSTGIILFSITIVSFFIFLIAKQKQQIKKIKADLELSIQKNDVLVQDLSKLEKYQSIIDTEKYCQEIRSNAEAYSEVIKNNATHEAEVIINRSNEKVNIIQNEIVKLESKKFDLIMEMKEIKDKNLNEADQIIANANSIRLEAKKEAKANLEKAEQDYKSIIAKAESEAKQIAGDAYKALKEVESLEKTAKAIKNVINGYGDEYIVPTKSLLDQLADDYSHTSAGEELKKTRERMRVMVKTKSASTCDYVEAVRRDTAIDFVIDAFNGKVDSIISSVKGDNYGILKQKIEDAFYTVNANGTPFRNARINESYLQVRLEELKLACTIQAIKDREREEQRRIKEQLREEEKATKEYERALKEAQRDQESAAKAIEKVRKDLEQASEAKRVEYETKLLALEQKLKEAEEKNKRAQSMAELTKSGHVYIISNIGSFGDEVLKIGMTRRLDPQDRIDELGDASVPFDFDVHALLYSEDAPSLEKELHSIFSGFQVNKVNPRKEFFRVNLSLVREAIEKKGIKVQWTMIAEAKEYRESVQLITKKAA